MTDSSPVPNGTGEPGLYFLEPTTFEYSVRHLNHRIVTGGGVAVAGIVILVTVAGGSPFFQLLLSLGIVLVLLHAARFYRLRNGDGVAVRVSPEGLQVAEWDGASVPWGEIAAVRLSGRTTVVVIPKDAGSWFARLKPPDRVLRRLAAAMGSEPFTIDAGLILGQPMALETAIRLGLSQSSS